MSKPFFQFLIENKNFRKLSQSIFSMSLVQGLDMILPLILFPYVIRIIGLELFGKIAFAQAIVGYLVVIINYGFHLTATREIAINKDNMKSIQQILVDVSLTKIILFIGCLIALTLGILFFRISKEEISIFYLAFFSLSFYYLIPNFFFQGLHDLKLVSIVAIVLKTIGVGLVFFFLKQKSDFLYYLLLPGIFTFLHLIFCYCYIIKRYKFSLTRISLKFSSISEQLKSGFYVFLSQVKLTFFNNLNILVIGVLLGDKSAGIFGSADKIIKAISALQIPVLAALYPYFSNVVKLSKERALQLIRKVGLIGGVIYLIPITFLFIYADIISLILFGDEEHLKIAQLMRIMCGIPILLFFTNLFGTQFLLNLNQKKKFLINMVLGASVNTIIVFPLTYYYGLQGTSFSVLFAEISVCILMFMQARKFSRMFNI